jgi:copper(I)-binding protein
MKPPAGLLIGAVLVVAGCAGAEPPVTVTDVQVVAPPPGRDVSVAYMTIHNDGSEPVTLVDVGSPQFARAEMHSTEMSDGVARMRRLDQLSIDAGEQLTFEPGGRHVMLFEPVERSTPAAYVTLHLHFASDAIVMVDAPVSSRVEVE